MRSLTAISLPLMVFAATPAVAQDADLHFTEDSSHGWCRARVWGGVAPESEQRMVLVLAYQASDGELSVTIPVYGWSRAENADPGRAIPMTLSFDTGTSTPSAEGGYETADNDGEDGAWGDWGPGAPSTAVMALLRTARSVHVRFDGMDLAFGLPAAGRMYQSLTACAARLRGG